MSVTASLNIATTCIVTGCDDQATERGLCRDCLQSVRHLMADGVSEERLVAARLMLPAEGE